MTDEQKPESAEFRTREDLLPCPFCGAPAERLDFDGGENIGGSCISCTRCGASGHVEFGFKENFVSRWNTRVSNAAEQRRKDEDKREMMSNTPPTTFDLDEILADLHDELEGGASGARIREIADAQPDARDDILAFAAEWFAFDGSDLSDNNLEVQQAAKLKHSPFPEHAAEQRRKDAKGAEPCAYRWAYDVPKGRDSLWHFGSDLPEPRPERPEPKHVTPLYTRPANVAALEERVKELEGALRAVGSAIEQADPKVLCCTLWMSGQPETVVDYISAAISEGGEA